MQTFYLYQLCITGLNAWNYVAAGDLEDATEKSKNFMNVMIALPLYIRSAQFGTVTSTFDYSTTLFHGITRYGKTEDGSNIFRLIWLGDHYVLDLKGYDPIQISGEQTIVFAQNGIEIAKMTPVPDLRITCEYITSDCVKRLAIKEAFLPILEILGAFTELRFAL